MRVVIDARLRTEVTTGAGRYLEGLIPAMARQAPKFTFILLTLPGNSRLWTNLTPNVEIKEVQVPVASISQHFKMGGIVSKLNADVFHYPMFDLPLYVKTPSVITIHDLNAVLHPDYFTRQKLLKLTASWMLHRLGIRKANKVITIVEFTKHEILKNFNTNIDKISVVTSGYERNFPGKNIPTEDEVRDKWKIKGPYLLYVGVQRPHKNLEALIRAFAKILESGVECTLVITGPLEDRFQGPLNEVSSAGLEKHVRFTGYVETRFLEALYKYTSLFVFPSIREGFGFPLVEAMDMKAPIACSDIPVHRDVAGDAAIFFDPLREAHIAHVIGELIKDSNHLKQLIEKGQQRLKMFSWEKAASQTLEVYNQVLAHRNKK